MTWPIIVLALSVAVFGICANYMHKHLDDLRREEALITRPSMIFLFHILLLCCVVAILASFALGYTIMR